jgi:hypothetical protein
MCTKQLSFLVVLVCAGTFNLSIHIIKHTYNSNPHPTTNNSGPYHQHQHQSSATMCIAPTQQEFELQSFGHHEEVGMLPAREGDGFPAISTRAAKGKNWFAFFLQGGGLKLHYLA